jgi:dimethylamine/trimethylamine dehydrogenase
MTRDPKYDILFEPIKIGPKTMRNRFYQTPHCSNFGSDFPATSAYMRGMKAEGGWAVVHTEYGSIHPEYDTCPWVPACFWDDTDVRNWSLMTDRIHEFGALAGTELCYGGPQQSAFLTRMPARGVSQVADAQWGRSCYEMTREEIRELQGFYVRASERARDAGFDLVNIAGPEASSITLEFLMKGWNKRTDEYGGSLENRARFWLETRESVRAAIGDDCAIAARFCVDTFHDDGNGISTDEEAVGFVRLADHLVDLWDLQVGGHNTEEWTDDAGPSRFFSEGFQLPWIEKIRPHTDKPIVGVGRFTDPDVMVEVIRNGPLDIIGAARPSIADPFLPKKIEEGRNEDIRACDGCNTCAARFNQMARIVCTQNPTMGEEYRRGWHPERHAAAANGHKTVLVVGAGPAGLECAMTLGRRGMRSVMLVEAAGEVGGRLLWESRFRGLSEWMRVVEYRREQIAKLANVEVRTNTTLGAQDVLAWGADLVVVATGSQWAGDGLGPATLDTIAGADSRLANVLTPEQVMVAGKEVPGARVLVYDSDGYHVGASLAEKLAEDGKLVTLVAPTPQVAARMFFTGEGPHMTRRLVELGVELVPSHYVTAVDLPKVTAFHSVVHGQPVTWDADAIVLVTQRCSSDQLYRELDADAAKLDGAGITGLFRIGDCVSPSGIAEVIFDGHRLAREIDSPHPRQHLPFIREHRVLGTTDESYDSVLRGHPVERVSSHSRDTPAADPLAGTSPIVAP